ncbi:uncharacterized protein LOC126840011 isoform X2 [Adelges cooleyi]|nr:uncharacterized protein LOC126840011 isoform X2 [Adelges cooleyi]
MMYFQLETTLFHKLQLKNQWLYATTEEPLVIACDGKKESIAHTINDVGALSLPETCKAYASYDLLIPAALGITKNYTDFVPTTSMTIDLTLFTNENVIPVVDARRITNTNQFNDLPTIGKSVKQLREQFDEQLRAKHRRIQPIINYVLAAGIICIRIAGCSCFIVIRWKKTRVDTQVPTNQNNEYGNEEIPLEHRWPDDFEQGYSSASVCEPSVANNSTPLPTCPDGNLTTHAKIRLEYGF